MGKTIAVSFKGDEYEIAAINKIAKERGITAGNLVASTLREALAPDLAELASFFRNLDLSRSQSASEQVNEVEHA